MYGNIVKVTNEMRLRRQPLPGCRRAWPNRHNYVAKCWEAMLIHIKTSERRERRNCLALVNQSLKGTLGPGYRYLTRNNQFGLHGTINQNLSLASARHLIKLIIKSTRWNLCRVGFQPYNINLYVVAYSLHDIFTVFSVSPNVTFFRQIVLKKSCLKAKQDWVKFSFRQSGFMHGEKFSPKTFSPNCPDTEHWSEWIGLW